MNYIGNQDGGLQVQESMIGTMPIYFHNKFGKHRSEMIDPIYTRLDSMWSVRTYAFSIPNQTSRY